MNPRKNSPKTP